jgi:hypothetical protein
MRGVGGVRWVAVSGATAVVIALGVVPVALAGSVSVSGSAPPIVKIVTPRAHGSYRRGVSVDARYVCRRALAGASIASCTGTVPDGSPVDSTKVGQYRFMVTAVTSAGVSASAQSQYRIVWNLTQGCRHVLRGLRLDVRNGAQVLARLKGREGTITNAQALTRVKRALTDYQAAIAGFPRAQMACPANDGPTVVAAFADVLRNAAVNVVKPLQGLKSTLTAASANGAPNAGEWNRVKNIEGTTGSQASQIGAQSVNWG